MNQKEQPNLANSIEFMQEIVSFIEEVKEMEATYFDDKHLCTIKVGKNTLNIVELALEERIERMKNNDT